MTRIVFAAAGLSLAVGAALAAEPSDIKVQVGELRCELTDKTNLIVVSNSTFACSFKPTGGKPDERYAGKAENVGVDLNITEEQVLIWMVFAPGVDIKPGSLAGTYVGLSADVAFGFGAGAKALLGGDSESIALQPVSLSGQKGLGAAAGLGSFSLTFEGAGG